MVRCFVGFLLPEGTKKSIVELQEKMKKWPMTCKMVEDENLHLNFSFLGEIDEREIEEISKKIDEIAGETNLFEVKVNEILTIPTENYIRVLALNVQENSGAMRALSEKIVKEIGGDSKPPHITLCRVRRIENKKMVKEKIREEGSEVYIKFMIDSVQLIKSELTRAGPVYSIIHEAKLSTSL
jgi:2'-5' RNA ligase